MRISEYLKSLGNSSAEVANNLRLQGIKGLKRSSCKCPIINAIYQNCPDIWPGLLICNGNKFGDHWSYCATFDDFQIMDPSLPQPVMDFIGDFDDGLYPDLEAKMVREVKTTVWN